MADDRLTERSVRELLATARDKLLRSERAKELLKTAHAKAKQEGLVIAYNVLATVEVVGMAFGMGYIRGYYGEKAAIMGLPIDAATGLLLHGVAYGLGFAGGKVAHFVAFNLHNLANGALATWASATGAEMGLKKRQGPQPMPQPQDVPAPPAPPQAASAGDQVAFGAVPQLPPAQMSWGAGNPWGAIPQQQGVSPGDPMAFGAMPPQLPPAQMPWNPWGAGNAWGAIPQQQGNPMTQEELAAAMAWQQQQSAAA